MFGVAAVFIDLIISPAANTDRQNKAETESTYVRMRILALIFSCQATSTIYLDATWYVHIQARVVKPAHTTVALT